MKEIELFTIVKHAARIKNDLSYLDYCLADTIYHLANNKSNKMGGWCYKSKENLAVQLGVSRSTIQTSITKLVVVGFIIRNKCGHLRNTKKWESEVIHSKAARQSVKKSVSKLSDLLVSDGVKTGHYNYIEKDSDKGFSLKKLIPSSIKLDKETSVVLQSFVDIFNAECQKNPTIGAKEIKAVQRGIKELGTSEALLLVERWFDSPNTSASVRYEIMVIFSTSTINKWKANLL
jgi:biotin operon repressor